MRGAENEGERERERQLKKWASGVAMGRGGGRREACCRLLYGLSWTWRRKKGRSAVHGEERGGEERGKINQVEEIKCGDYSRSFVKLSHY